MRSWLKRKMHISWFITWLSMGFLGGALLSVFSWNATFASSSWLLVALSIFTIAAVKRLRFLFFLALCAGLLLGIGRGTLEQQALSHYQSFYGRNIAIQGKVTDDTSYGPKGDQRIRLSNIKVNNQDLSGEVWVSTDSHLEIKRGDQLKIQGTLKEGFGNIPASIYKAKVIGAQRSDSGDVGIRIRDSFAEGVKRSIPEPESNLGLGYLVGQRSSLPELLDQQIKTVGLSHAVVASGYNLTILVAFSCRLFTKKSKYLALSSGILMISGFMLITGFSPSMSRAGLVSSIGLLAWYYGRKIHPFVLLSFAAAITVLIRPSYIWGDLGWYLSFTAFAGILILAPLINHYFWGYDKKPHKLRLLFVETLSAQLVTAPIIIFAFSQYSPYSLFANLLVLPLVPLAMFSTFVAGLVGLIAPSIAPFVGIPATVLLSYSIKVIEYFANLPNARLEFNLISYGVIFAYSILILAILFLRHKTKHNFRKIA